MTIFGQSRLGRLGYALMLLLLFGFDFVKQPIERYVVALQDAADADVLAPIPVADRAPEVAQDGAGRINGKEMPFMMSAHEDIVRDMVKRAGTMSKEQVKAEIERRLQAAGPITPFSFQGNKPVPAERKQAISRQSQLAGLYPVVAIGMLAISVVGLLWMVSSRLRDIGWPQYYLLVLIAPVFLAKYVPVPAEPMLALAISLLFYAGIILLALVPREDDDDGMVLSAIAQDTISKRRNGFGQR
jgi:uncharacterized membrane protein YhaH (DUF805 family)